MTVIKASCPGCGEIDLTPTDIALMVCTEPERTYYRFVCSTCEEVVCKPADDNIMMLLAAGGVRPRAWTPQRPPLTEDDLVEFVRQLAVTDCPSSQA